METQQPLEEAMHFWQRDLFMSFFLTNPTLNQVQHDNIGEKLQENNLNTIKHAREVEDKAVSQRR